MSRGLGRIATAMLRVATLGYREDVNRASAEALSLVAASARMAFMLGVRFLAEFLTGNRYFRIYHPRQNLDRAQHQLVLARGLAARAHAIHDWLVD